MAKFFVGGLAPECSEDDLRTYFGQFGELVDVAVMRDAYGAPRCFGFIQFADAHTCRPTDEHVIVGKKVDVKAAVPRESITQGSAIRTNKIFVGGLSKASTADSVRAHFSAFGNVTDVLMKYNEMGESRGFCFVEFDSEDIAEAACSTQGIAVDGKQVECKLARPLGDRSLGFGKGGKGDFGKGFGKGGFGKGGPMRMDFFGKGNRVSPYGSAPGKGYGGYDAAGYGANGGYGKGGYGKGAYGGGRGPAPAYGGKGGAADAYGAAAGYAAAPAAAGWGSYGAAAGGYPATAGYGGTPAAAGSYGGAPAAYGGYSAGSYGAAPAATGAGYNAYGGYGQGY